MTLKELRKIIKKIPKEFDDAHVIMQKDSEGNGYSPLCGIDKRALYVPDSAWGGDIWDPDWSAEDACMEEKHWEEFKKITDKAIVLFPIN